MTVYVYDYEAGGPGYSDDLVDFKSLMKLPCGGIAYYDENSGISYRCAQCMAVVGSIAQPQSCKDEEAKWEAWAKLGGQEWDYFCDPEEWE